jgi:phosphomannomutase
MTGSNNEPTAFIFDVDGTLTPSRSLIDPAFESWLVDFCIHNDVYLVTGSDRPKTLEQLGSTLYDLAVQVYQCSGNSVWNNDIEVERNIWTLPTEARQFLTTKLDESDFSVRTGIHIEDRPGMANFSIVGRGATVSERAEYVAYEFAHKERQLIADAFNSEFMQSGITAQVAGDTGIDIVPTGKDKSQIIHDFDEQTIYFFGDSMEDDGNDAPLKQAILNRKNTNDKCFTVTGWEHTWNLLHELSKQGLCY